MENEMRYIVKSGAGYFIRFIFTGSTMPLPLLTTDPMCGTRVSEEIADNIVCEIGKSGYYSRKVPVRFARRIDRVR